MTIFESCAKIAPCEVKIMESLKQKMVEELKEMPSVREKLSALFRYFVDESFAEINLGQIDKMFTSKMVNGDFSKEFSLICKELGIKCDRIIGVNRKKGKVPHSWNVVYLEDGPRYVDTFSAKKAKYRGEDFRNYFFSKKPNMEDPNLFANFKVIDCDIEK